MTCHELIYTFCTAYGKRCKTLPAVGHAPSGLGQYGLYPLDADTNLYILLVWFSDLCVRKPRRT